MAAKGTCCLVQAPELLSFLEAAHGSHLCLGTPWGLGAPRKVLWVPWDRRSWDTGLPYYMARQQVVCVCMWARSLSPASKWDRHPRVKVHGKDKAAQDHGKDSMMHRRKDIEPWKHSWILLTSNWNLETTVLRISAFPRWTLLGVTHNREALRRSLLDLSLPAGPF